VKSKYIIWMYVKIMWHLFVQKIFANKKRNKICQIHKFSIWKFIFIIKYLQFTFILKWFILENISEKQVSHFILYTNALKIKLIQFFKIIWQNLLKFLKALIPFPQFLFEKFIRRCCVGIWSVFQKWPVCWKLCPQLMTLLRVH
jgi:hypothetical protein